VVEQLTNIFKIFLDPLNLDKIQLSGNSGQLPVKGLSRIF